MKDERKTERNTEWSDEAEADRDFLREKLKNAGDPALPASLSAAALFERMDAEEQRAAEPAAAAPKKKGGVIWLQWRRWGSIAAVLVLAAGVALSLATQQVVTLVGLGMICAGFSVGFGVAMSQALGPFTLRAGVASSVLGIAQVCGSSLWIWLAAIIGLSAGLLGNERCLNRIRIGGAARVTQGRDMVNIDP